MNLIKKNNDTYLVGDDIISIGNSEIDLLKDALSFSTNKRVRVNIHPNNEDLLHEMFIVLDRDSYIRPHKHLNKSESFHIVYGDVDVVIFEDNGTLKQIVSLSHDKSSGKPFYYRMSRPYFHTLIIRSNLLILHEITNGPFIKEQTLFGNFAPEDVDKEAILDWQIKLNTLVGSIV